MKFNVEVEKTSSIVRKLKVRVPAAEVKNYLDRGFVSVQKTSTLKGFRPGQAPIAMIKQFYGDDVRHRVFHSLIDESLDEAVRQESLRTVGHPKIDTSAHQTGEGAHDHGIQEDQDLVYTAVVEIFPEVQAKSYTGLKLNREVVKVTDEMVEKVVKNFQDSQAQLVPVGGGLALADGSVSSRPAQQGDFVDAAFSGGLVTESGLQAREDMKGSRVIEIGSNTMIPGFEDQLIGMRAGESKTFRIRFPENYGAGTEMSEAKAIANQEAEFSVTVQELKEKKLPTLDDEFVKQMGYESVADLREKAKDFLTRERTQESDGKLQSALVAQLIEKNPFDVPTALVDSQTQVLAQEWSEELKRQGYPEKLIQDSIRGDLKTLKSRAESQVRASLLLENISQQEKISVSEKDIEEGMAELSKSSRIELNQLEDYYAKNPGRKGDLEFRLRQERAIKFLLDKAEITSVEASEK
jgi:trigger factor